MGDTKGACDLERLVPELVEVTLLEEQHIGIELAKRLHHLLAPRLPCGEAPPEVQ